MNPDEFFIEAAEIAARLDERDCPPLATSEVDLLQRLVYRATGGCRLAAPPAHTAAAMLPGAWLAELHAMSSPHLQRMVAAVSRQRTPPTFYDPLADQPATIAAAQARRKAAASEREKQQRQQ